jgi:protein-S-isoprenylcysteine O-methyltransferase Ste14
VTLWEHVIYGLGWASFGLLHSVTAADSVKRRLRPWLGAHYRLTYNLVAVLHLAALWLVGRFLLAPDPAGFARPDWLIALQWTLLGGGLVAILAAGRLYDLSRLGGMTQIREARSANDRVAGRAVAPDAVAVTDEEPLHTHGLHRYVRHPLYAAAFPLLWGVVSDELSLATAVYASTYLLVGAWFEEQRLLARYGPAYADYRRKVPAFLPWRGRAL